MAYFPMFVDIKDKLCLVVGGGEVALRKVGVLLDFGAKLKVVAPWIMRGIAKPDVIIRERKFEERDLEGAVLVVAATNDKAVNHRIAELAKAKGIPVNAVDQPSDCTFIFPSYVKEKDLVGAVSSSGKSPLLTQLLRDRLAGSFTEQLGEMNDYLGSIRPVVSEAVPDLKKRRAVYERVLHELRINSETALSEARLIELIDLLK